MDRSDMRDEIARDVLRDLLRDDGTKQISSERADWGIAVARTAYMLAEAMMVVRGEFVDDDIARGPRKR